MKFKLGIVSCKTGDFSPPGTQRLAGYAHATSNPRRLGSERMDTGNEHLALLSALVAIGLIAVACWLLDCIQMTIRDVRGWLWPNRKRPVD